MMRPMYVHVQISIMVSSTVFEDKKHASVEYDTVVYKDVCYEPLGCFSTDPPFGGPERPLVMLPQSPQKMQTRFILHTRQSKDPQYLDAVNSRDALDVLTNFQPRLTIFIIHGFLDTIRTKTWMKEMTKELLLHGDYNVFIVDWSGGNFFPYTQATANTRVVGAQVAYLANYLISSGNITAADVHIIGHSLGAQTAGYAGERIPRCGRISGLDPAGPLFVGTPTEVRLDPSDAVFVDTIHTDMPYTLRPSLGTTDASGHANFYPNGGHDQPGCGLTSSVIQDIMFCDLFRLGIDETITCSHIRAHQLYSESINSPCPFTAFRCASEADFKAKRCQGCQNADCSRMGFHADKFKPPPGQIFSYFLRTADKPRFCR
ncbi:unnamed protein product, partial [Candidula unifasciata]